MKLSQYNHIITSFVPNKYIAFNALTGAYIELDDAELRQVETLFESIETTGSTPSTLSEKQQQLLSSGFAINDDFYEVGEVHRRYNEHKQTNGLSLTITPTIGCNFGCGYCFQKHSNRKMGDEDIANLKRFVAEKLKPNTYLGVTWFGGEPLTAFGVIEALLPYFAELCAERNCSLTHNIITNGYLLDVEKAKFLSSYPQCDSAQITIDGAPDYHNERRHTLGGGATFGRIVKNLKAAAQYIDIMVRVNVDRHNYQSLEQLLTILKEEGLHRRISIYLGHVWEYTEEVEKSDYLSLEEFAAVEAQFKFMKFRMGFSTGTRIPKPRTGVQCVADNPNGYVLSPDGLLFNCWNEVHLAASDASGRYDQIEDVLNQPAMQRNNVQWQEYDPFTHNPCRTCNVAPLCMSGCPWESRKNETFDPGHCIPLKFNLADELRLYQLEAATREIAQTTMQPPMVDACAVPAEEAHTS